jgi:Cu(I)/Ag(I) efflux system membrane protein CusA/SilA
MQENLLMPFLIYQKIRLLFSEWMGRSPQVIEDQVTILWFHLQNPKIKNIRFFHVWNEFYLHHFEDNVDPYWARTRVPINYAQRLLPQM